MSTPLGDPLGDEHRSLRDEAMRNRKAFQRGAGASLGAMVMQAVDLAGRMKADGATMAERMPVIEATVREAWPRTREWHYACESCRDTGLQVMERVVNRIGVCVDEGYACHCPKGRRFDDRPKSRGNEDFTSAGKMAKPKGFTRFGR